MKFLSSGKTNGLLAILILSGLTMSCSSIITKDKTEAPLMKLMDRFAAAEKACPGKVNPQPELTAGEKQGLPGRGLAQHPMLYIGEWCRYLYVINDGKIIWTYGVKERGEFEDAWMLSNGNIVFARLPFVAMVTPEKETVWRYDAPKGSSVATCQPIGQDKVMFVQNGKPPKLFVMNIKTGKKEVEHELDYDPKQGYHAQFRRARYTPQGTYLVAYQLLNKVVEYDKDFKKIWEYDVRSPWAVVRLNNGNTLITNERDVKILEVNPQKEIVWQLTPDDLPPEYRHKYAQSSTRLANGNTIFCTHVGRGQPPQLIEVTPDKKVVWMLRDWTNLGGSTAVQILDEPGVPEEPGGSQH